MLIQKPGIDGKYSVFKVKKDRSVQYELTEEERLERARINAVCDQMREHCIQYLSEVDPTKMTTIMELYDDYVKTCPGDRYLRLSGVILHILVNYGPVFKGWR